MAIHVCTGAKPQSVDLSLKAQLTCQGDVIRQHAFNPHAHINSNSLPIKSLFCSLSHDHLSGPMAVW